MVVGGGGLQKDLKSGTHTLNNTVFEVLRAR